MNTSAQAPIYYPPISPRPDQVITPVASVAVKPPNAKRKLAVAGCAEKPRQDLAHYELVAWASAIMASGHGDIA